MDTIDKILKSGFQGVLAITGGGTGTIDSLLKYGGGSSVILNAVVPYSTKAFVRYVKSDPGQYCSENAAKILAETAFQEAKELSAESKLFGVGVTASLAKRGVERVGRVHKAYIAIKTTNKIEVQEHVLKPDLRINQEEFVTNLILETMAKALNS